MILDYIPTWGTSLTSSSSLNVAMRKLYQWVRHANSGSRNYDAPDLMVYILAMDSIYTQIAYLSKILGLASLYSGKNRYYGKRLIQAHGIDYEDLISNLPNYRLLLNNLIAKVGSFAVPATFPIVHEHLKTASAVLLDENLERAQMYSFRPKARYDFSPTASPNGSSVQAIEFDYSSPRTLEFLLLILSASVEKVLVDEDMNIMSGDILKAYGDNIFKITTLSEDYVAAPIYDETMLDAIRNITITPVNISSSHIEQDGNSQYLTQYLSISQGSVNELVFTGYWDPILATSNPEPSPSEILAISKFSVRSEGNGLDVGTDLDTIQVLEYSTEIVISIHIFTDLVSAPVTIKGNGTLNAVSYQAPLYSAFAAYPTGYFMSGTGATLRVAGISQQINNYFIGTRELHHKIHEAIVLSLWNIDQLA